MNVNAPRKIRLGAVNYLNTKPLIYRLPELAPQVDLILDLPSRLADGLAAAGYRVTIYGIQDNRCNEATTTRPSGVGSSGARMPASGLGSPLAAAAIRRPSIGSG